MSDFHDLDDVFDALRGPAMPAELADEANSVDLMATAHFATKGKPMHSVSRRTRVATLVAAGVLGFGGAAAASGDVDLPGNSDFGKEVAAMAQALQNAEEAEEEAPDEEASEEESTEEESIEEDSTEEESTEEESTEEESTEEEGSTEEESTEEESTEEEGSTEEEAVPFVAEEVEVDEVTEEDSVEEMTLEETIEEIEGLCQEADGEGEKNHGQWVRSVARGEKGPLDQFRVQDVARSDCGKDFEDEIAEEEETEESEPIEESSEPSDVVEDEPETDESDSDSDSSDEEERKEGGRPDHAGPKKTSDAGDEVVDADESDDDGPGKGNGGSNGKGKGGR